MQLFAMKRVEADIICISTFQTALCIGRNTPCMGFGIFLLPPSATKYELEMEEDGEYLVPKIKLGSQGLEVSAQGLGCQGLASGYGPPLPDHDIISLLHYAASQGVTLLDTSDIYGNFTNEILVGKTLKGIREQVQMATKFGLDRYGGQGKIRGDPSFVRAACEVSLKRLDIDCIDLYFQHRVDTSVPIEVTVGEMKKLVEEGKVKYIGLSEASPQTIRRAHAVHPIMAVQIEWSLWSRDVEEEIIPTCRELGIGNVAYSPLGRGFLSYGPKIVESLSNDDVRKCYPRFQADSIEKNKMVYDRICEIASRKGCSPSQLTLAWVRHQGNDVVPIPGTTKIKNLKDNIASLSIKLMPEELREFENAVSSVGVVGYRYPESFMHTSWTFANTPPLTRWKHN